MAASDKCAQLAKSLVNDVIKSYNQHTIAFGQLTGVLLSELIAEKHHQNVSETSAWIKRKLCFCLFRTAVICIRGSRSRQHVVPIGEMGDIDTRNNFSSIIN